MTSKKVKSPLSLEERMFAVMVIVVAISYVYHPFPFNLPVRGGKADFLRLTTRASGIMSGQP